MTNISATTITTTFTTTIINNRKDNNMTMFKKMNTTAIVNGKDTTTAVTTTATTTKYTRRGAGGMMFICVSLLLAMTMAFVIRINWISTSHNTAREIAQVAAMSVAAVEHASNTPGYTRTVSVGETVGRQRQKYAPATEVRRMLQDSGIASHGGVDVTYVTVNWNPYARKATVTIPAYKSYFNTAIAPVTQSAVVEYNDEDWKD